MESKVRMTNATGIVAVVFGSLLALGGLLFLILGIAGAFYYAAGGAIVVIIAIIMLAFAVGQIVMGAMVAKKSQELYTNPGACTALLIALAVTGGIVVLVMALIALCMDGDLTMPAGGSGMNNVNSYGAPQGGGTMGSTFPGQGQYNPQHGSYGNAHQGQPQGFSSKSQECEQLMARLKQYKADGVITEEVYKQKVEEIVNKMME